VKGPVAFPVRLQGGFENCAMRLHRRELLKAGVSTLLSAGVWPGALAAGDGQAGVSLNFVVINDTHYLDDRCGPWLEKAVRQMKDQHKDLDFCLMLGDLGEHGRKEQIAPLTEILKGLGRSVYYVIGNHDYVTQTDRTAFESVVTRRLNYSFEYGDWQFVGLDSSAGQDSRDTSIGKPTLQWLDDELPRLDKKKPLVIFTHFPLGPLVPGRPKNAKEVLERFKEFNLQACFSGHFHAFTERQVRDSLLTTNRCFSHSRANHDGDKKKGYFLCQAKDGKLTRTFVEAQLG
jgi:3',5'-cyclic AMP phosphodiesterase CpdA